MTIKEAIEDFKEEINKLKEYLEEYKENAPFCHEIEQAIERDKIAIFALNGCNKLAIGTWMENEELKEKLSNSNKKGEWICTEDHFDGFCSVCGRDVIEIKTPFCPWCGADMRKDGKQK